MYTLNATYSVHCTPDKVFAYYYCFIVAYSKTDSMHKERKKSNLSSQYSMPMDVSEVRKYSLYLGFQVSGVLAAEP